VSRKKYQRHNIWRPNVRSSSSIIIDRRLFNNDHDDGFESLKSDGFINVNEKSLRWSPHEIQSENRAVMISNS